jgi:hypothetical protein
MDRRRWSDADLIRAVSEAKSIASVLHIIGLVPAGGNYSLIKSHIRRLRLDTNHFTGQGWSRGWELPSRGTPLAELLVAGIHLNTGHIKKRLIKDRLIEERCARCGISDWLGQKLSLHLDHKNGARTDFRMENLWLLCPNCHSQTPTYCGRNASKIARA